ncbi:MAG TPA: VOC family protein [Dehalococcoidia bacterium]|jgi:lactoylglutathione lyase|nr:VOC family protein [Dehalococcoidia bacterium]
MAIQGVGHTSITVKDLERSVAFYKNLGFEDRGTRLDLKGEFIEILQAIPGANISAAALTLGSYALEIIAYNAPAGYDRNPLRTSDVGGFHICVTVDSADQEYERLRASGMEFKSEVLDYQGGIRVVYGWDPDGNTIELLSSAQA